MSKLIDAGRQFFQIVFGQDSDIEFGTSSRIELFEISALQLDPAQRAALAAWLEPLLERSEPDIRDVMQSTFYLEEDPADWADPDDRLRTGPANLVRYAIKVLLAA